MLTTLPLFAGQAYHENHILFALRMDVPDLQIKYINGRPQTQFSTINDLLARHNVIKLEKWLRSADDTDIVGEVNLSKVYRAVLLTNRSWTELQDLRAEFTMAAEIHSADLESRPRILETPQNDPYVPNDTRYSEQWYVDKIRANYAWGLWSPATPGDETVLIGVVDTGVDYTHPDMVGSLYINPGEDVNGDNQITAADDNGLDDDGNGYVDDYRGWDFAGASSGSPDDNDIMPPDAGPDAELSHGTHVTGICAATVDNSEGISGISFRSKVIATKNATDDDLTQPGIVDGYDGILYCAKMGAKFINCSWGGPFLFSYERNILDDVSDNYGAIVVGAAGNDERDNDSSPQYPSDYSKCISVAATTTGDLKAWYSNWGSAIDISAPGGEGSSSSAAILSTIHVSAGSYAAWQGTSMAAPVVTASFALLKAWFPTQSRQWLLDELLANADPIDDINPDYAGQLGSGRVNIYNAIARNSYPYLTIDSYQINIINDDGDGQLNPGESARLVLTVANNPNFLDATAVTANLSSSSSHISFSDASANLGDIPAGSSATNSGDDLIFDISLDAPLDAIPITVTFNANASAAHPYTNDEIIEVTPKMFLSGFPFTKTGVSVPVVSGQLIGDSRLETVIVGEDDSLYMVQSDGAIAPGFPVYLGGYTSMGAILADMDNDGDDEIVVSERVNGYLKIIENNGSILLNHTIGEQLRGDLAVANMDGDAQLEIVFGTMSRNLHVMNIDGSEISGFPISMPSPIEKGVALGDVDGDNIPEIVYGLLNTDLYVTKTNGTNLTGFPVDLSARINAAPLIADLNGTIKYIAATTDKKIQVISSSGSVELSQTLDGVVKSAPALGDIDGDANLDLVFGTDTGKLYAINLDGTGLTGFPVQLDAAVNTSPALRDMDNNGNLELLVSTTGGYIYLMRSNAADYTNFPAKMTAPQDGSGCLADIDGDGDFEAIVGGGDGLNIIDATGTGGPQTGLWFTYLGNNQHTGYYFFAGPNAIRDNVPRAEDIVLNQNYPNPFNPGTKISFILTRPAEITLLIYDMLGQQVATLAGGVLAPGYHEYSWDGKNSIGMNVVSGIYIYKLKINDKQPGPAEELVKKMLLIR